MAHNHSTPTHHDPPTGSVEPDAVDASAIVRFAIGLTVVLVASHLAMMLMFRVLSNQSAASDPPRVYPLAPLATEPAFPGDPSGMQPPEPRLQSDPKGDLSDLRAGEDAILNGYGWVDRNNNIVRIPIDTAMRLTLQRGLPSRAAAAPQAAQAPAAAAPATQNQGKEQGK